MLLSTAVIDRAISLDEYDLRIILRDSGYYGMTFAATQFVGLNEHAQFVYDVTFHDESGTGEIETGKVFVTYDESGKFLADF